MITTELIINLLLILVVAWIMGSIFNRFGLPTMLGELLAGVILGPPLLNIVHPDHSLELMAELGIFFVMFYSGMEMDANKLLKHIKPSISVALGGFILPFALGFGLTYWFGGTLFQSLFIGMGISITAIAVQTVILNSMKINKTSVGHIIIGAAIIDDILSLVALSILLGLAKTGAVNFMDLVIVVLKVIGFFVLTIVLGHIILPKFTRKLHDREGKGFTFALGAALVMAYLAELAGLHLVIGAFLAGQFVRKEIMEEKIFHSISDRFYAISYGFLVPIFFVSLSFHLHFEFSWAFITFASALTLVAILGKLIGCGFGAYAYRRNMWDAVVIGFGMNGRGAVEMVVAIVVIGLSNDLLASNTIAEPLLTEIQFSSLILMAFITTMLAPITLKWSSMKACQADEKASFCSLWDDNIGHDL